MRWPRRSASQARAGVPRGWPQESAPTAEPAGRRDARWPPPVPLRRWLRCGATLGAPARCARSLGGGGAASS
eukprot:4991684-Pyramimonas_sp.AAC.1